ncbi:MAG: hypothetical protein IPN68_03315 [Bacteroidetes bacterium]|nr:hypothetical protein [Bacteroidota bacterium]
MKIVILKLLYSFLMASTGFLVAAFRLCKLTVQITIINAKMPARRKIQLSISVLYE